MLIKIPQMKNAEFPGFSSKIETDKDILKCLTTFPETNDEKDKKILQNSYLKKYYRVSIILDGSGGVRTPGLWIKSPSLYLAKLQTP